MTVTTFIARLACAYLLLFLAWWLWCVAVEKVRELRAERDDRAAVERAYRRGGWHV